MAVQFGGWNSFESAGEQAVHCIFTRTGPKGLKRAVKNAAHRHLDEPCFNHLLPRAREADASEG